MQVYTGAIQQGLRPVGASYVSGWLRGSSALALARLRQGLLSFQDIETGSHHGPRLARRSTGRRSSLNEAPTSADSPANTSKYDSGANGDAGSRSPDQKGNWAIKWKDGKCIYLCLCHSRRPREGIRFNPCSKPVAENTITIQNYMPIEI